MLKTVLDEFDTKESLHFRSALVAFIACLVR